MDYIHSKCVENRSFKSAMLRKAINNFFQILTHSYIFITQGQGS